MKKPAKALAAVVPVAPAPVAPPVIKPPGSLLTELTQTTFVTVGRLSLLFEKKLVRLSIFDLTNPQAPVQRQPDIEVKLPPKKTLAFAMNVASRGALSRTFSYWHDIYDLPVIGALGSWAQPFPLEFADYPTNHDGAVNAAAGISGHIKRLQSKLSLNYKPQGVKKGMCSTTISVWKPNPEYHLVLWLEAGAAGSIKLGNKEIAL